MKAMHATVYGTELGYGGYRATIMAGKKAIVTKAFRSKGWGRSAEAYAEMKTWLSTYGVA